MKRPIHPVFAAGAALAAALGAATSFAESPERRDAADPAEAASSPAPAADCAFAPSHRRPGRAPAPRGRLPRHARLRRVPPRRGGRAVPAGGPHPPGELRGRRDLREDGRGPRRPGSAVVRRRVPQARDARPHGAHPGCRDGGRLPRGSVARQARAHDRRAPRLRRVRRPLDVLLRRDVPEHGLRDERPALPPGPQRVPRLFPGRRPLAQAVGRDGARDHRRDRREHAPSAPRTTSCARSRRTGRSRTRTTTSRPRRRPSSSERAPSSARPATTGRATSTRSTCGARPSSGRTSGGWRPSTRARRRRVPERRTRTTTTPSASAGPATTS